MAKPCEIKSAFLKLHPNLDLLEHLFKKYQKDYLRTRLKAIQLLWVGKSISEVIEKLDIDRLSLRNWIKILLKHGVDKGLKLLATPKKSPQSTALTLDQEIDVITMIEIQSPLDYGYDQHIFTGKIVVEIVKDTWGITITDQTVYNIFHRHDFSYQRGHRDYENADPALQKVFAERFKADLENIAVDEKMVLFDEFSVTNRPTIFYGWARVNTKFSVPSDESKKRERLNGLLAVDAITGQEYIKLIPQAKAEDVADYFYDLCLKTKAEGFNILTTGLDNNSTHKNKMKYHLWLKMYANPECQELHDFKIQFFHTPPYSPDFNLAEYIIHQLRLKLLHRLPSKTTLEEVKNKIIDYIENKQLQTKEQIKNIINHILKLGKVGCII